MGATTPPDRRRSLFLFLSFFFFVSIARVSPIATRANLRQPISILFQHARVFEFRVRFTFESTFFAINNEARLVGSCNRTDRDALFPFYLFDVFK